MKKVILFLFLFSSLLLHAQEGIQFNKGSWAQVKEAAAKEGKLIFADVYTQWCGPCYNMAKKVFVLYSVGTFYNTHFVNVKIDAENGEGIDLAKKFAVRSYPTYLFIDPVTEQVVHRSSGNQPAETFLFTGASALNPETRSLSLEANKKAGNSTGEFLLAYAKYKGSCYSRNEAKEVAEQLIRTEGYGLDNPAVWDLFEKYISSRDNALFKELVSNIDKYRTLYGTDKVDAKIYAECQYVPDANEWNVIPDFKGKDFLMLRSKADRALKAGDYETAAKVADLLMANPGDYKEELCRFLRFFGRSNLYGEHPQQWHDKCLDIIRYVAYNSEDRDAADIHFEYATQLEKKLQRMDAALPAPAYGAPSYSMRPADLKAKPIKKK